MEKLEEPSLSTRQNTLTRNKTVLVIDDDTTLLSLYKEVLEADGYDVCTAQSGVEALSMLSLIEVPDLILLDMQMEGLSGVDFLITLEETRSEIINTVPVVFLTAMDMVPASRATGFIRKPMEMDNFLKAVHRFIKKGVGSKRILN